MWPERSARTEVEVRKAHFKDLLKHSKLVACAQKTHGALFPFESFHAPAKNNNLPRQARDK
jgi:hypothetical protein